MAAPGGNGELTMLNLVDQLISRILDTEWTTTPPPAKPGFFFTIPDEEWQAKVKQGLGDRLNIYLYEFAENRNFRRSQWDIVDLPSQTVALSMPPAYFDCHYLISAWSPAEDGEATNPVLDEHQVLAEALRILMANPDVNPTALGIGGGGPVFQNAHVYLTVTPPEAPRILNDFWTTMKLPWRPAIQLVVTAPLDLLRDTVLPPLVVTMVQRYVMLPSGTQEELVEIGGWVLRAADDAPIASATVQRLTMAGEVLDQSTTDAQGRFIFTGLVAGVHRLRATAPAMTPLQRDLDILSAPLADHVFKLS
jgi:hypothetical protein